MRHLKTTVIAFAGKRAAAKIQRTILRRNVALFLLSDLMHVFESTGACSFFLLLYSDTTNICFSQKAKILYNHYCYYHNLFSRHSRVLA